MTRLCDFICKLPDMLLLIDILMLKQIVMITHAKQYARARAQAHTHIHTHTHTHKQNNLKEMG